jgi:hypothetical protein
VPASGAGRIAGLTCRSTRAGRAPMIGGMSQQARQAAMLLAGAFVLLVAFVSLKDKALPSSGGLLTTKDGQTVDVTGEARAAGFTYDPGVTAADRVWIEAAIANVRPEAAALIAEVDGLVTVRPMATGSAGGAIGLASGGPGGFTVDLDLARLNNDLVMERSVAVVHELGHIIDFALVDDATLARFDAGIPRGGGCGLAVNCDQPAERFADTFAKWALRGAMSVGSGYGVPMPASIEGWGEPLGALGASLPK